MRLHYGWCYFLPKDDYIHFEIIHIFLYCTKILLGQILWNTKCSVMIALHHSVILFISSLPFLKGLPQAFYISVQLCENPGCQLILPFLIASRFVFYRRDGNLTTCIFQSVDWFKVFLLFLFYIDTFSQWLSSPGLLMATHLPSLLSNASRTYISCLALVWNVLVWCRT